jgi:methylmalonyl-CoA/ethylmalonyl-CoA epimerase
MDQIKLSSLLQIRKVPLLNFREKGEGIHHIAFDVEDITAEIARLKEEFVVLNDVPKKG